MIENVKNRLLAIVSSTIATRGLPITATHIKNGLRNDPRRCPLALAIKEQFHDEVKEVEVLGDKIHFNFMDGSKHDTIMMEDISDIVKQFDETGTMEPVTLHGSYHYGADHQANRGTYRRGD